MKPFYALALTLPLGACSVNDMQLPSLDPIIAFFEPARPDTRPLSQPIQPVTRSSVRDLRTINVTSLVDGESASYSFRPHGKGIRVRESNGCTWTRAADWFSPSDSWSGCGRSLTWSKGKAKVHQLDSLYPLKVGSVGRYTRRATSHTGSSYVRETQCEVTDAVDVLRPRQVATPAYVVECDDSRRRRITWYAPGEGPIAYRETHRRNGLEEAWIRTE